MLVSRVTSNGSFAMMYIQALHTAQHRQIEDMNLKACSQMCAQGAAKLD